MPYHISLRAFLTDTSGAGTVWSLFWAAIFLLIGGLAVDGGNAWRVKAMLQATADSSALAGAIALPDESNVDTEAKRVSQINMNDKNHGSVVTSQDIIVGTWDSVASTFTPTTTDPDAVRVIAKRIDSNNNPVPTFLLKVAQIDTWDVAVDAVAQRFTPYCIKDGLVSAQTVEISASNGFYQGICVHGQLGVKMTTNNYFEPGVVVGMYDLETLEVPADNTAKNEGLAEALTQQHLEPRLVAQVDEILSGLLDPNSDWQPSYMSDYVNEVVDVKAKDFDIASLVPGTIYNVSCNGQSAVKLTGTGTIEHVVIVTSCPITFDSAITVSEATLATSSTSNQSFSGSASARIGLPDNCAPGGGAQLITAGDVHFAAKMEFHGSQIVAKGTVTLAAQVNGLSGTSVQAGGSIKLTSQSSFALCAGGEDGEFAAAYYRIVQ